MTQRGDYLENHELSLLVNKLERLRGEINNRTYDYETVAKDLLHKLEVVEQELTVKQKDYYYRQCVRLGGM